MRKVDVRLVDQFDDRCMIKSVDYLQKLFITLKSCPNKSLESILTKFPINLN